jgi:hypothetical protein
MTRLRDPPVQAALIAVLGGISVFIIATVVFPYHTSNHDEAVYLQQAAMLLDGQLFLRPPVDGPFRPWFFVESERGLYPKYTPVTAGMFAIGKLLGGYRIALGLIATGTLAAMYHTVREAFDAQTGVVASVLLLASPLFVIEASVFLSYVPTLLWNLTFAAAYLHADRTGSRRTAVLAGVAVGIAFFARAYTAVLFATPFIAHALWSLRTRQRETIIRLGLTALCGSLGVVVTLWYNAVVTGDPLVFPYEAFAPRDGLGFGRREILGYSREFTPELSLRANGRNLWQFVTAWAVAGPLGPLAALFGIGVTRLDGFDGRKLALAGVGLSVPIGNLYFWGTVNLLGNISDPTDGLIRFLGPYYHTDLLVPTAAFGAVAVVWAVGSVRDVVPQYVPDEWVRPVLGVVLVCALAVGGGGTAVTLADPITDNYDVTQQYESAYEPFEERSIANGVVFLPRPYGNWLNHPFQPLRNDPGFEGDVVYAMDREQFAVAESYPDRQYYRYVYRGQWAPFLGHSVDARLQPIDVVSGDTVQTNVTAQIPDDAQSVTLRLTDGDANEFTTTADSSLSLGLRTNETRTRLTGSSVSESVSVPTPAYGTVELLIFSDFGFNRAVKYRIALPVDRTAEGVRALTPLLEVCWDERRCGGEAAYVPGAHEDGIELNATTHA